MRRLSNRVFATNMTIFAHKYQSRRSWLYSMNDTGRVFAVAHRCMRQISFMRQERGGKQLLFPARSERQPIRGKASINSATASVPEQDPAKTIAVIMRQHPQIGIYGRLEMDQIIGGKPA